MGELRVYSGYCRKRWKEKVHESTLLCMITYCYNITVHTPQNIVWISSCTLLRCHTGRRGRVCGEMPFGGTFFFFGGGTLGMYFVGTCWDPGHHWDWQSNVWNLDKAWFFVGGKIWLMESSTWVYWVYNYRSQSSNKKQLFHSRPPVTWASALDGSFCLTSTDGAGGPIWVIKTLRGWVVSRTIWDVTNLGVIPCNGYSLQNSCVGYFMIISFFTNFKEDT